MRTTFATTRDWMFRLAGVFGVVLALCFFVWSDAQALVASPARIEIEADPGERVRGELLLINDEQEQKTFYSSTENFEASGESGVPKFVPSEEGLDTWIEVVSEVTLSPGENKKVPFAINTPADSGVGGHFAAIFWSNRPPDVEGGNIAIGAKVGVLAFLRVRGEITEKGQIIEFGTLTQKKLFDCLPVDLFYRFENRGNDRTKPIGELVISNMFGREKEKITANDKQGSVLPESVRKFFISWGREGEEAEKVEDLFKKGELNPEMSFFEKVKQQATHFACGRYTANLDLKYGLGDNSVQSQMSFWVIPWQLLSLVLLALIVLFGGGRMLLKNHNKRVIARAKKELEKERNGE